MSFSKVNLHNFRSYDEKEIELAPGVNVFVGRNGVGKTNLLEALYVLGRGKSFRDHSPELIHRGQDWYRLEADFGGLPLDLRFERTGNELGKKSIKLRRKAANIEKLIEAVPLVLFEPSDNEIISGSPDRRRRFIDGILSGTEPDYLRALVAYRRLLRQRNALLRSAHQSSDDLRDQVFVWDVKLAELASRIVAARGQLLEGFGGRLAAIYEELSGRQHGFEILYDVRPEAADYGSALLLELERRLPRDIVLGATSAGPHRDDVQLLIDGREARHVASRGEVRTLVLALKLLEREYVAAHHKKAPVLLLDDVFSELDQERQKLVLARLDGSQTVITTTELRPLSSLKKRSASIIKLK